MNLAVFTPLNPARCGVSDYCEALLPRLAEHAEVAAFVDEYPASGFRGDAKVRIVPAAEFRPDEFDAALYHIGNNPYHLHAFDAALKHPGIVVLHEFNLHHLVAAATISRDDWPGYLREAEYNGGPEGLRHAKRVQALEVGPDYEGLAMNKRLLERARAVIVHSGFLRRQVRDAGFELPVAEIPHGAWLPEADRNRFRDRLGVDETTPLIGIFGFLKPYKRIAECLRAMQRLVRLHPRAKMILVGEEHPDFPIRRLISQLQLEKFVRVLGHVPIDEFEQLIGAVDICLNLRYPTAGETSGTLLRALGLGRAVIVSDVGAFSDLPDEISLRVPVGAGETDLIFQYLDLLASRPGVARSMGSRARDYVARNCSWPRVAELYARSIEAVVNETFEARVVLLGAEPAADLSECEESSVDAVQSGASASTSVGAESSSGGAEGIEAAGWGGAEAKRAADPFQQEPPDPKQSWRAELAGYLKGLQGDPSAQPYLETHLMRFVHTLEITPRGSPEDSVLEMGAYMQMTPALKHKLGYGEVSGCYLGEPGKTDHHSVTSAEGEIFRCDVDLFDAEKDIYPYANEAFATVLCCELIEHLYDDPMHLMAEVNRILRPGGHLVLSTPNICSLRAMGAILLGYHPGLFHQYIRPNEKGDRAPRHSREYAPRDIQGLFQAAGFEVVNLHTEAYNDAGTSEHDWVKHLLARYELPDHERGEAIYAVGRKTGGVAERYPAALYDGSEE